jgi:hypothetical protein
VLYAPSGIFVAPKRSTNLLAICAQPTRTSPPTPRMVRPRRCTMPGVWRGRPLFGHGERFPTRAMRARFGSRAAVAVYEYRN